MMNGDTYFDTGMSAYQVNTIAAFIYYMLLVNYFIFGILKVALAQVEEGYLESKISTELDWICDKKAEDPS